ALLERHADGARGEALGDRMHDPRPFRAVGPPVHFSGHATLAMQHETVEVDSIRSHGIEEILQPARVDAHLARPRPWQSVRGRSLPGTPALIAATHFDALRCSTRPPRVSHG